MRSPSNGTVESPKTEPRKGNAPLSSAKGVRARLNHTVTNIPCNTVDAIAVHASPLAPTGTPRRWTRSANKHADPELIEAEPRKTSSNSSATKLRETAGTSLAIMVSNVVDEAAETSDVDAMPPNAGQSNGEDENFAFVPPSAPRSRKNNARQSDGSIRRSTRGTSKGNATSTPETAAAQNAVKGTSDATEQEPRPKKPKVIYILAPKLMEELDASSELSQESAISFADDGPSDNQANAQLAAESSAKAGRSTRRKTAVIGVTHREKYY